jgi:hypothetical protein
VVFAEGEDEKMIRAAIVSYRQFQGLRPRPCWSAREERVIETATARRRH